MTTIRLTALQINELELLRVGAYGPARTYLLPGANGHRPTLLVPNYAPGPSLTLLDSESTPVAEVATRETKEDPRGTWVAGEIRLLREPPVPVFSDLRPALTNEPTAAATLLLGHHARDLEGTVIVVDSGDHQALARTVHALRHNGHTVRVLPEPAAEHLSTTEKAELLVHLASVAFASKVHVVRGETPVAGDGVVVLLTGLSGSGKSTAARLVTRHLRAESPQRVTLLDGDEVRGMLSSGLGFSREDRDTNVRRIGWVATQIAAHGGVAICAPIAPYDAARQEVRAMAERVGRFILVHVATPLDVCEARDSKGLYARARAGQIEHFTGISDPYEEPRDADVTVGLHADTPEESASRILAAIVGSRDETYMI